MLPLMVVSSGFGAGDGKGKDERGEGLITAAGALPIQGPGKN